MLRATIVSVSGENDKNLISFIASTVESMRDQMVTKEELVAVREQMATKKDLAEVKDQVARVEARVDRIESQMATKNDLGRLETTMHGEFEQVHLRLDSIDR